MFFSLHKHPPFFQIPDFFYNRLAVSENRNPSVLLKINLARPPVRGHPRTDPDLLNAVIRFFLERDSTCTIAESANGYLEENLESVGLGKLLDNPKISIRDLDLEQSEVITMNGETHYIPRCLRDYDIRIAIPATSKRPGAVFSNNVKLFVGAVPRRMYQNDEKPWRGKIHHNLHHSIATIYQCIMDYAPFHLYINGGIMMQEGVGEFPCDTVFVGDDGAELDRHIIRKIFGIDEPDYLQLL